MEAEAAKTITDDMWLEALRKARTLYYKPGQNRFKIAKLAMDVCDRTQGGHSSRKYTVNAFARAVGLNGKTIHEWIRLKETVVDKLGVKVDVDKLPIQAITAVFRKAKSDMTNLQVRSLLDEEMKRPSDSRKWEKYLLNLNTLITNSMAPPLMEGTTDEVLKEVVVRCKKIVKYMNLEIEFRAKHCTKKRSAKKAKKFKDAIDLTKTINI